MKYTFIRVFTLAKKKAKEYTRVTVKKYNPYHGADGKFTTASGAGGSAAGGEAQASGASQTKETSQASGGNGTSETTQITGTKEEGKASGKDNSNEEKPKKVSENQKHAEKITNVLNGIKTSNGMVLEATSKQMYHSVESHKQIRRKWFRDLVSENLPTTKKIFECTDIGGKRGIAFILDNGKRQGVVIVRKGTTEVKTAMAFRNKKELTRWVVKQVNRIKEANNDE